MCYQISPEAASQVTVGTTGLSVVSDQIAVDTWQSLCLPRLPDKAGNGVEIPFHRLVTDERLTLEKGVCLKLSWSLRKHTVESSHADRLLTADSQFFLYAGGVCSCGHMSSACHTRCTRPALDVISGAVHLVFLRQGLLLTLELT